MKLTNKLGLPQPIYDAVKNDPYTKGDADYSITGLIRPPRIAQLSKIHFDEIEEDCADRIFSLFGQVIHGILERADITAIAEQRLFAKLHDVRISGGIDRMVVRDKLIQDYKLTSIWKLKDGVPIEFEQQLNSYAWLYRRNGYEVDALQIVALYRDWSKGKTRYEQDYPQHQCQLFDVNVWPDSKVEEFLLSRIEVHKAAEKVLPVCTDEDRWATPDIFAVVKQGGKRAVASYHTHNEAVEHVAAFADKNYEVQFRPGVSKRCASYCGVARWCEQYKGMCENQRA